MAKCIVERTQTESRKHTTKNALTEGLTLTSFPSLTGLRPDLSEKKSISGTLDSKLTLDALQAAAYRENASLTEPIQIAWAEILEAYNGTKNEVTFLSILPDLHGNHQSNPLHLSSSRHHAQNVGRLADGSNQCQWRGAIVNERVDDESSPYNMLGAGLHQIEGSLLDLEMLLESLHKTTISERRQNHIQRPTTTVQSEVASSEKGYLSIAATALATHLNREALQLMLQQFDHILTLIVLKSDNLDAEIPVQISPLLHSISNTQPTVSETFSSLQSQFESFARSDPQRVALEFATHRLPMSIESNTVWTYGELNTRAEALAANLQNNLGDLPSPVVPICMDRCPELYAAILGILKAGRAWCPIDPSFPPQRCHDLIVRSGAKAIVVNALAPEDGIPKNVIAINIENVEQRPSGASRTPRLAPDSLAYLIWTSGTTGPPKGVPITHQAAVASMKALQECITTEVRHGGVRCLQFSQFTFDVFVQDLFYTWGVGGTLISADRATMLGSFAELTRRTRATHAHLTPAFAASVPRENCSTLEVVTMIGEKLTQDVATNWSRDCKLYNTYGPAEATVVSTLRLIPHGDLKQSANIGYPLPEVSAFVIRDGEPVLRNGIGELALGGLQLSEGYWGDPVKTSERFVWHERLGATLYMTGDVVRQLHDGTFEFIGRTDDLVKIQGIRIELSEIAFALRGCHSMVHQVEVQFIQRPDRPSEVLVAFLAMSELTACTEKIIINERAVEVAKSALKTAKAQLPDYMIPKAFLVVGAIPRTASAKIDRAATKRLYKDIDLRAWEEKLGVTADDYAHKDLNAGELLIAEDIAELTGTSVNAMSRGSSLPSIGVDSITATRLATRLHKQSIDISVVDVLQGQTLGDLLRFAQSEKIETKCSTFDAVKFHHENIQLVSPALAERIDVLMPALPIQESLLSESFQDTNSYWSHNFFSLDSGIDLERLRDVWKKIADCTDALRTAFIPVAELLKRPSIDSTFLQIIYKESRVDWAVVSCIDTTFKDQARACAVEIAYKHHKGRFVEPLWAVRIFVQESSSLLMLSTHHSIRDDSSLDSIMADLASAYLRNADEPSKQRQQLRDATTLLFITPDQSKRDEEFWKAQLSDFIHEEEATTWPELRLSSENPGDGTIMYRWRAEKSLTNLQVRATRIGAASIASLLRVVWGCIILHYLEADKTVFGETWSVRGESSNLVGVVGPLITVVPVPFKAEGTLREMLQRDAEFQKLSRSHRMAHPSSIRKILQRSEDQILYPAIFNFVADASEQKQSAEHTLWRTSEDIVGLSVEHAIAFNAYISTSEILELELTGSKQYMDTSHLKVLAQQLDTLFNVTLQNPDSNMNQLGKIMPQNQLSLTAGIDDPLINQAWTHSPAKWVDKNAVLHPEWCAAEVAGAFDTDQVLSQSWSYLQLQRAYQNVAALMTRMECTKKMIAVSLDRRLEVYAVILAIMSTGNTYLPIAEDLPKDRKLFLLQDSDAIILFTTKTLASEFSEAPKSCRRIFVEDIDYSKYVEYTENILPQPSDGAYLLYTSGSTGTPKGVIVSRGNLMSFIEAISNFIRIYLDMESLVGVGKWLGMASYAFDVHLLEMFFPWRHGMATVTAPRGLLLNNLEMALQTFRITHASFVPSLVDNAGLDPANLPDLRYMSVGGEKITKKAIDTWSGSHVILANAYGPTEMTIGCCFKKVELDTTLRNVGYPLSYTTAHVLRPGSMEYALRGTSGELCLTGDLVATGYHRRPDAKGFIQDFHGHRMYRTGDKARVMADGSIEFLGRDDDQTKIRGQRIELGEVSEAVRSAVTNATHVQQVEVASIIVQHPSLARPQLAAFISLHDNISKIVSVNSKNISFDTAEVFEKTRAYCRSVLPSFMLPEHLIRLTCLPLVPSSRKVDSKGLRALFNKIPVINLVPSTAKAPISSSTRTMTEKEMQIREVAAEVLAVDQTNIELDTNLFRIGLDSLNAISLTIKLQKMGFDSTVSSILKRPTAEQIALLPFDKNHLTIANHSLQQRGDLDRYFRSKARNGHDLSNILAVRPCLPLQETLIASSLNHEGEALYVNHVLLELSLDIDHQKLIRAWNSTAEDHDILRTCFHDFENHFVQLVLRYNLLSCNYVSMPCGELASTCLQQRQSEIADDIVANIGSKPPIRLSLAETKAKEETSILMVSLHHGLYDEQSFSMILDEVYARYQGEKPSILHTPIGSLIEYVNSLDLSRAEAYWVNYLRDFKSNLMPPTEVIGDKSMTASKVMSSPLRDVDNFAASVNGTTASVIQALFGVLLLEISESNDVVFGTILSGRVVPVENAHAIVAPCITTIPQRVRIKGSSSLKSIVSTAQEGFMESIEYQHVALRDIHRWVKARKPLFDTLFSFTRKRKPRVSSRLWHEMESSMPNEFKLTMEIVADAATDKVMARCDFTTAFGTLNTAESMLKRFNQLISSLVQGEGLFLEGFAPHDRENSLEESIESQWTRKERLVRDVCANFVGIPIENVEKSASFFALGIDSITAIQFARELRDHSLQCSSADIMRYPCIGELAQRIALTNKTENMAKGFAKHKLRYGSPLEVMDGDIITIYPCTPLQSSMLTQSLGSNGFLYVHYHAVKLRAQIAISRVRKAWETLVAGTEILRTSFHFDENNVIRSGVVHNAVPLMCTQHDSSIKLEQIIKHVKDRMVFQEEGDFARPPWAIDVVGNTYVLSMHHSLYDGETLDLLFEDLSNILEGAQKLQRTPFSYAARTIREHQAEAVNYWIRNLEGFQNVSAISLASKFQEISHTLKIDLTTVLKCCKSMGVTLQTMSLFAFAKTLALSSGQQDIVFGHVVRGRTLGKLDGDGIIGPMFNTVPMRINLTGMSVTNEDALKNIQSFTGRSQAYQHASLGQVQQRWRDKANNSEGELFDSLFVFQKRTDDVEDPLWAPVDVEDDTAPSEYPLNLAFEQRQAELGICVNSTHNEDLDALVQTFEHVFCEIFQHPKRSAIAYLPETKPITWKATDIRQIRSSEPQTTMPSYSADANLGIVRKVLSEISGIPEAKIASEASIFSLGLDSISAIKIAVTSRKEGLSVSVADILQGRTLMGICQRASQREDQNTIGKNDHSRKFAALDKSDPPSSLASEFSVSNATTTVGWSRNDIEDISPCSPGQWYHLAVWLKSGRTLGEATFTYASKENLILERLLSAWRSLRERHPILRTSFSATGSEEMVQIIFKPAALKSDSFQVIDYQGIREDMIGQIIKQKACSRFDLFSPPSELLVLRSQERDYMVLRLHHACYDAWTISILRQDLIKIYQGEKLGANSSNPYVIKSLTKASNSEGSRSHWRESLNRCQPTILRSLSRVTEVKAPSFFFVDYVVPNLSELERTCHQANTSLPTIVLVAFARMLARHTSISDPTFGLFQNGRSFLADDMSKTSFPCLNMTPLMVRNVTAQSILNLVEEVQSELANRVPFEQSYLLDICKWLNFKHQRLFNTFVNIIWDADTSGHKESSDHLLSPYLGVKVEDVPPETRVPGRTAVDALNTNILGDENLFLDVQKCGEEDELRLVVRCDVAVMSELEAEGFPSELAGEIRRYAEECINCTK